MDLVALQALLRKADVILVEGNLRISAVIKYLTQSSWSHAVLYAGGGMCIEADVLQGVRRFPLSELAPYHLRVCRPISLTEADADIVVAHAQARLGAQYDLKHVADLARYMVPLPVPRAWRRRAIAVGSADPSRAICSTLVAEAFQAAHYPILPEIPSSVPPGRQRRRCGRSIISTIPACSRRVISTSRRFSRSSSRICRAFLTIIIWSGWIEAMDASVSLA
ncbi:hypothetical protein GT370_08220 [Acidocella sp. MX-AZ03]|uniref:hypothetical protein n=1 Tax=Acidocella sp. MX-AZ03 TaxID=2697363 RepID=UPI0022DD48FF|nr:hypothetical protein [Acidocella sp. MX-AZ03]WBO60726.1 hypothetical protein GT370_08220 [Acidocella sp. MX-AZ03]